MGVSEEEWWRWPYDLPTPGPETTLNDYVPQQMKNYLHEYWLQFPVLHPLVYLGIGIFWIIGGVVAVVGNGLVLYVFSKAPELRSPANLLVLNLAFADFMLMACLVPEFLVNCFMGGIWMFGGKLCTLHAFAGALFGYVQIVTLVFISYDRFRVIVYGYSAKPLSYSKAFLILGFIWVYSLGWAVTPLFGFGRYTLDGILTECSFDYLSRDFLNVFFIWLVCFFCYAFPLAVILLAYFFIAKAVFAHEKALRDQAKKMNVISLRSTYDSKQQSVEIKIATCAILNVSLWVVAWTPFTIISLIGVSGDQSLLTPLIGSLSVVFAKTSCTYNPIIYAILHPKFRIALKRLLPWACACIKGKGISNDTASQRTEGTKCTSDHA